MIAKLIAGVGGYDTLKATHNAALAKGQVTTAVHASRVLVALGDFAANVAGIYAFEGRIQAAKAAEAIAAGDTAYFDAVNNVFTKTAAQGLIKCGLFVEAATQADTEAVIELDNCVNL